MGSMTGNGRRGNVFSLAGSPLAGRAPLFYVVWALAALTYGVGDVVTTLAIYYVSDVVHESNALVAASLQTFGRPGLVGLKLVVFIVFVFAQVFLLSRADSEDPDWLLILSPPVLLWVVGILTTAINSWLLLAS